MKKLNVFKIDFLTLYFDLRSINASLLNKNESKKNNKSMFYNGQQDESIVPSISSENIQNNCKTVC